MDAGGVDSDKSVARGDQPVDGPRSWRLTLSAIRLDPVQCIGSFFLQNAFPRFHYWKRFMTKQCSPVVVRSFFCRSRFRFRS